MVPDYCHDLGFFLMAMTFHNCFMARFWYMLYHLLFPLIHVVFPCAPEFLKDLCISASGRKLLSVLDYLENSVDYTWYI